MCIWLLVLNEWFFAYFEGSLADECILPLLTCNLALVTSQTYKCGFPLHGYRFSLYSLDCFFRDGSFAFAEVHALYVQDSRQQVDEEETNYCAVYVNYGTDRHAHHRYGQAQTDKQHEVNHLGYIHLALLRLTQTKHSKNAFPV